jgi:hypothetical protein
MRYVRPRSSSPSAAGSRDWQSTQVAKFGIIQEKDRYRLIDSQAPAAMMTNPRPVIPMIIIASDMG